MPASSSCSCRPGFAMVETGFTRAKNAAHTMAMNFMVYADRHARLLDLRLRAADGRRRRGRRRSAARAPLNHEFTITLVRQAFGLFGLKGFFLSGGTYDVGVFALFLFQMVFMDTAGDDPHRRDGRALEVLRVHASSASSCRCSSIRSTATGCGAAAGCRSSARNFGLGHGHVDFAGSSVVHMAGGVAALAGAIVHRPAHRQVRPRPAQSTPIPATTSRWRCRHVHPGVRLVRLQPGLDAGRHRPAHRRGRDQHHAGVGAGGAIAAMLYMWKRLRQAGSRHDVQRHARRPGGDHRALRLRHRAVGGAHRRHRRRAGRRVGASSSTDVLKIDDPVGAISVHGVNGAWGVLSRRPVRRRHVWRRLERRARHGQGAASTASRASSRRRRRRRDLHRLGLRDCSTSSSRSVDAVIGNRVSAGSRARRPRHPRDGRRSPIPTSSSARPARWVRIRWPRRQASRLRVR